MTQSDEDLMQQYQSGDDRAFAELENRHSAWLEARFHGWLSLPNPTDAQDLANETWMGVVRSKATFDPARGAFKAWLYGIARHIGERALAKHYRGDLSWGTGGSAGFFPIADKNELVTDDSDLMDIEAAMISRITLAEALEQLSPSERELIFLFHVDSYTCAEIAKFLSCSIAAAKSRLRRARCNLIRHILSEVQAVPREGAK